MFFFQKKREVMQTIKIRDEWGKLHVRSVPLAPRLTAKEEQDQLGTTVLRRDHADE